MGLETDDVFSQELKSSEYLNILFNCLQKLETEMKSIKEILLLLRTGRLKALSSLMTWTKPSILSTKNWENLKLLKKENSYLNKRLEEMDAVVDRQEQYSRRNCLLVHGIVEETVQDTDEKIINTLQQSIMDETICNVL